MTIEELESELKAINDQRDALSKRAKELAAELDKKRHIEAARARLAAMSGPEREALALVIEAETIPSAESFPQA